MIEPSLATKQQEPEGVPRQASEAAVHFTLDHRSGLLLFRNTLPIERIVAGLHRQLLALAMVSANNCRASAEGCQERKRIVYYEEIVSKCLSISEIAA